MSCKILREEGWKGERNRGTGEMGLLDCFLQHPFIWPAFEHEALLHPVIDKILPYSWFRTRKRQSEPKGMNETGLISRLPLRFTCGSNLDRKLAAQEISEKII